jgi:hypothetical protein
MALARYTNATNVEDFVADDMTDDLFTEESEDDTPETPGIIPSGWEAALKATESNKKFTNEFKFTEERQLVKFLSSEPFAVYNQHWIERAGKRSFTCLEDGCPLCAIGDEPRPKVAFSIVNLSSEETVVEMLVTSPTLTRQLAGLNKDPKTGPLDRIYWALSKTGTQKQTSYQILPVKPRDLAEDWGVDQAEVERVVDQFEPLDRSIISFTSRSELEKIAAEVSSR